MFEDIVFPSGYDFKDRWEFRRYANEQLKRIEKHILEYQDFGVLLLFLKYCEKCGKSVPIYFYYTVEESDKVDFNELLIRIDKKNVPCEECGTRMVRFGYLISSIVKHNFHGKFHKAKVLGMRVDRQKENQLGSSSFYYYKRFDRRGRKIIGFGEKLNYYGQPYCQRCDQGEYRIKIKKCVKCGREICSDCIQFHFNVREGMIHYRGKKINVNDLIYCKDCESEIDCEICQITPLEDKDRRYVFFNCDFCKEFICDRHSYSVYGVRQKYGHRIICFDCFNKLNCIKCGKSLNLAPCPDGALFNKNKEFKCATCVNKRRERAWKNLNESTEKHSEFQGQLVDYFKKMLKCNVTVERRLNDYSVDICLHNPKTHFLYGFELKTGSLKKDVNNQLQQYDQYFDYFYIIVNLKELKRAMTLIDEKYGIFVIDKEETNIELFRQAKRNRLTKQKMLENFKDFALRWICVYHRLGKMPTELEKMKRSQLIRLVNKRINAKLLKKIYSFYVVRRGYDEWFWMTNRDYRAWRNKLKQKKIDLRKVKFVVEDKETL